MEQVKYCVRVQVITGSRSWRDPDPLKDALAYAEALIVGDATGADALSLELALLWDIIPSVFCASPRTAHRLLSKLGASADVRLVSDWQRHGTRAGPIRNAAMVHEAVRARSAGFDVVCHAFPLPGSVGTLDCIAQLEQAGFSVTRYPW